MDDGIPFYDRWRTQTPEDEELGNGIEPDRVLGDGMGIRHELEAYLATGAGINVPCSACDYVFWVVTRLPPKPFLCPRCSGRDSSEAP
jgi:hypothetical protein